MHFVHKINPVQVPTSFNMFVLTSLINFALYSIVLAEGNIFINKPVLQNDTETRQEKSEDIGDVRCFCNLPKCVSSGYICKSPSGGCFSNLLHQPTTYNVHKGLHGCLELLTDKEQRDWCKANPNSQSGRKKKHHPRSLLQCCYSHMCNHVDNPETTNLMAESAGILNEREDGSIVKNSSSQQIDALTYSNSEVWFKAATIAVPICGAIIVLILIVLAVRLLRSDSHNNTRHKLGSPYTLTKNSAGKWHHGHCKKPHHSIRKESIPAHQNTAYLDHSEELHQIQAPLVQKELRQNSPSKNTNTTTKFAELEKVHYSNMTNKNSNFEFSNFRGHLDSIHQKSILCDVPVSDSLLKNITYNKANITSDYDGNSGKIVH